MPVQRVVIIGFGGFAREASWLIREVNRRDEQNQFEILGHVISDLKPQTILGQGLLGDFNWLEKNRKSWDSLVLGVGTPHLRRQLTSELGASFKSFSWPSFIHPSVIFERESAKVEQGVQVCANVVGTVNLVLREFALINLACTLGHESEVGACSVLNPTANISGGVRIGREALVGTGAQVLQLLSIGERANIGAGAVVTKNIASGATVVGVPAKPLSKA